MRPIKTPVTNDVYRAPPGREHEIGDLPVYRPRHGEIHAVYTLTDEEREAIANGACIELGIYTEPIPPVSLGVVQAVELEDEPPVTHPLDRW